MIRPRYTPLPVDRALRVLLVENDSGDATRTEAALRAQMTGPLALIRVETLADGVRTLMEVPFDVVVLELDVADATGVSTVAGIRAASSSVPVVVYTRNLDDALMLRAIRAGAQECLAKHQLPASGLAHVLGVAIERQRRLSTLEDARSEAAHRATHDPLTGLANRDLFLDQLERALAFGARYARKTGILFVDLDGFKAINDTLGHARGDALLQCVARRLTECVRRSDTVARLGGDEFVILLPDVTSRRDIAFVRNTILDCLREAIDVGGGHRAQIEASVGGAMSPLDGETPQQLMDVADAEMYREKDTARRGRLASSGLDAEFSPELVRGASAAVLAAAAATSAATPSGALGREARLRSALENDEFEVHFQPIVDTISGRVVAAEALLRWRDPVLGLQLPASFLPLAEDTGLIVPIGERVLRDACESLVEWRKLGAAGDIRMSVNLSAVQLRDHGFDRRVADILADTGCPPESIVLELSENSTMVDGEVSIEMLRALKDLGLRLLVDDFGVGYASLTFLRQAPLDGIKIDRRFIAQMLLDQRDLAIVASLVQLARGLGLDVIAEGVESAEQSQRLTRLQCFTQQGRHFSDAVLSTPMARMLSQRPIPASDGSLWSPRMLVANGG